MLSDKSDSKDVAEEAPVSTSSPSDTGEVEEASPSAQATELVIEDVVEGDGDVVKSGDTVEMHYTGWLLDGTKFDSSIDRGQPFETVIGVGQVIKGWDEGVPGMRVGGTRKLTIPPNMAYGARGAGDIIPPNATLVFEIELLSIRR